MNNFSIPSWTESLKDISEQYSNSSGILPYSLNAFATTDVYRKTRTFQPTPLDTQQIVTIPIYCLVFLLSVSGNLLVIVTLIQNKRMRTVTNVFLLNLSVSDLLLAVFCMPFTIVPIMLKNFIFGPVICVLIRYLQGKKNICGSLKVQSHQHFVLQTMHILLLYLTVLRRHKCFEVVLRYVGSSEYTCKMLSFI